MVNFPVNPTIGQIFTGPTARQWIWNGYAWDLVASGSGATGPTGPTGATGPSGAGVFFYSDSAPAGSGTSSIDPGSLWYHSDTGVLYIYTYDGTSYQWVTPSGSVGPTGPAGAGDFSPFLLMGA